LCLGGLRESHKHCAPQNEHGDFLKQTAGVRVRAHSASFEQTARLQIFSVVINDFLFRDRCTVRGRAPYLEKKTAVIFSFRRIRVKKIEYQIAIFTSIFQENQIVTQNYWYLSGVMFVAR